MRIVFGGMINTPTSPVGVLYTPLVSELPKSSANIMSGLIWGITHSGFDLKEIRVTVFI
jgi:hypothetical protein